MGARGGIKSCTGYPERVQKVEEPPHPPSANFALHQLDYQQLYKFPRMSSTPTQYYSATSSSPVVVENNDATPSLTNDCKFEIKDVNGFTRFHPAKYSPSANDVYDDNTRHRAVLLYAVRDRREANIIKGKNDSPYLEGTGRLLRNSATIKDNIWDAQQEMLRVIHLLKEHAEETTRVFEAAASSIQTVDRQLGRAVDA